MINEILGQERVAKILPQNITSYDLLKAFAVITMVVDHVGYYFYEDVTWWRVIGRLSFPVWFFLVGYARGRDFSAKLWIGGAMLVAASMIAGQGIFPLNTLFSIILIRLLIDPLMRGVLRSAETFIAICTILVFLIIPSYSLCEYGAQGLLMAMLGYVVRNRPKIEDIKNTEMFIKLFAVFSFAHYFVLESILFGMTTPQVLVFAGALFVVCAMLYRFKPMEFPKLTEKLPGFAVSGIRFMGRRTLEIYVAHLILFKFLGMFVDPTRFQPFQWQWVMG